MKHQPIRINVMHKPPLERDIDSLLYTKKKNCIYHKEKQQINNAAFSLLMIYVLKVKVDVELDYLLTETTKTLVDSTF